MQIILVRHAEAVPLGTDNVNSDFDRYLTPLGEKQAAALACALKRRGTVFGCVVSSPLVRAVQTAEPLGEPILCELLAPAEFKPKKLAKYSEEMKQEVVVLVGHNPDISAFAEWLTGSSVSFDKASAMAVYFRGEVEKGTGQIEWYVDAPWFMR